MNSLSPNNNKIARNFTIKADQRNDFFHSSGYGATQNSGNIGTASSGLSMAERKALEEKRQFVQKYGNSKLVGSTLNLRHSQSYDPASTNSASASADFSATSSSSNTVGSATGDTIKNAAGTPVLAVQFLQPVLAAQIMQSVSVSQIMRSVSAAQIMATAPIALEAAMLKLLRLAVLALV